MTARGRGRIERGAQRLRFVRWPGIAALLLVSLAACGFPPGEAFDPVSDRGSDISRLFVLSLALSLGVVFLIAALLFLIVIRFRDRGDKSQASGKTGDPRLEVAWTVAPFLLLLVLFTLTVRTMRSVQEAAEDPLHVRVTGNQWWWNFEYIDNGDVSSPNELHLPVDQPVEFTISSSDVIHSFWVPRFGWKVDAIPGQERTMTLTPTDIGVYDGACAEFCGNQHAWMRMLVVVEPADDFEAWMQAQERGAVEPQTDQARGGQDVFLNGTCVSCHTIRGTDADGTVGPDLTHVGSRENLGAGVLDNTHDQLKDWIRDARAIKPGILMPPYPVEQISEQDLESLTVYLEGLK
ncbi:MAG: cytochrome c oxidase subunit II [Thermomicrobiales bacterium]